MVYRYFTGSSSRNDRLQEVQGMLDQTPHLKLVEPHDVRWLSLDQAVTTFFRVWPAIVTCLENDASGEGLQTTSTASQAKAKGILARVSKNKQT